MKKILIIGAGFLQTYVIKKAKELGYHVIAVDGNPQAEGFTFCDEHEVINIVDYEACYEYAKRKEIDGVLTCATDYGVLSAAYISEKLRLPGIPYKVAQVIKNKYLVKNKLFEAKADDTDKSYEVTDTTDFKIFENALKYPVMVKPCDGSGSRGASKVNSFFELEVSCKEALENSLSKKAIIEAFVEGSEYGVESFVYKNKVYVLGVMKKHMTQPPYYAELGHLIPCGLNKNVENNVKQCVIRAIETLGVTFGSVNMDLIVSKDNSVHIVDIGARMGGNLIGSHVIPSGTGIKYIENMIKAAVGDEAMFEPVDNAKAVATRLLALTPGVVEKLPDFCAIENEYNVKIEHHLHIGDKINEYHTNLDGCGYVVAEGENIKAADENAAKALNAINKNIVRC